MKNIRFDWESMWNVFNLGQFKRKFKYVITLKSEEIPIDSSELLHPSARSMLLSERLLAICQIFKETLVALNKSYLNTI